MKHYAQLRSCAAERIEFGSLSIFVLNEPAKVLSNYADLVEELAIKTLKSANEAFGVPGERTPESMRERLWRANVLALLDDQGDIVGFSSGKNYRDEGIFYLDGVAILPKAAGGGKGTKLVEIIAHGFRRITCTTQNPVIFRLLRNISNRVFPSPDLRLIPVEIRSIANRMRDDRGQIDLDTLVIRDLYPSCRYPTIPMSRDREIDKWFSNALNIVGGQTRNGFFLFAE